MWGVPDLRARGTGSAGSGQVGGAVLVVAACGVGWPVSRNERLLGACQTEIKE